MRNVRLELQFDIKLDSKTAASWTLQQAQEWKTTGAVTGMIHSYTQDIGMRAEESEIDLTIAMVFANTEDRTYLQFTYDFETELKQRAFKKLVYDSDWSILGDISKLMRGVDGVRFVRHGTNLIIYYKGKVVYNSKIATR